MRTSVHKGLVSLALLWTFGAQGQVAQLPPGEIEQRNAAAAFASNREATLFLLVGECSHLMANGRMEEIARGWLERNRPEMEATYVWLDRYFSYLKATNQQTYQQASLELTRSGANALLQTSRVYFGRKPPTTATCEKAASTFSIVQTDFKNMGQNPGYEQFAEFPATLARIHAEPGFTIPSYLKFGMEKAAQGIIGVGNLASLDAVDAAKERGDGPGRVAILQGMAERGDGHAAQQIGLIYLNGQQVEKSPPDAYRWFYAAWSLSESEGLNAMGVMQRDGIGVPVNLRLAAAAFYLAKAASRSRDAYDRVTNNLERLEKQISPQDKSQIACMHLGALDEAIRAPIRDLSPLVNGKSIAGPERPMGLVIKDLADAYQPGSCH